MLRTMSSRNKGGDNTAGRSARAPLLGSEDPSPASTVLSSPERPEATGQSESLRLSGIVATSNVSASAYVTKDDLASALAGLEEKMAKMIASVSQSGKKHKRSPSPLPVLEQEWADDIEVPLGDREEGQADDSSSSEDSISEESFSASQSQKLLVQSFTELVRFAYKWPPFLPWVL